MLSEGEIHRGELYLDISFVCVRFHFLINFYGKKSSSCNRKKNDK